MYHYCIALYIKNKKITPILYIVRRLIEYRNHAKDGTHRRDRTGVRKKKQERHDLIVFPHPHRRDGTGCDLSDVNPRLSATATGHFWAVRGTVCSRFLWHAVSYISSGRHSPHVPLLYRRSSRVEMSRFHLVDMEIVCSQPRTHIPFGIAPIGEMAPGVPWKNYNQMIWLYFRTGIGEMAPIGEIAPGVPKKEKIILCKNVIAPGAILRMITVVYFFSCAVRFGRIHT